MTECNQSRFEFEAHFSRRVEAEFSGERLTTEGGALLLRAVDRKIGLLRRVESCFTDARDAERIEHELSGMLAQRIYGLALGYEDLNDHEELRNDVLFGMPGAPGVGFTRGSVDFVFLRRGCPILAGLVLQGWVFLFLLSVVLPSTFNGRP